MYLYIYHNQKHIHRNRFKDLLSGNISNLLEYYSSIEDICIKWRSINYLTIVNELKKPTSKCLEKLLTRLFGKINVIFYYPYNKWDNDFVHLLAYTNFKKIILVDDLHSGNKKSNYLLCNQFNRILSTCSYKIPQLRPELDIKKVVSFPHYMNDELFISSNNKKKRNVLFSGTICSAYPERIIIDNINNIGLEKLKLKLKYIDYYKQLNTYLAGIATSSKYDYIVNKYLEIPSSNTLLLGYNVNIKEELIKLGFIDGYNYIGFDLDNLETKIEYICKPENSGIINKITKRGYKLVNGKHKLSDRIKLLDTIVKELN